MKLKHVMLLNCIYVVAVTLQETKTIDILPVQPELKTALQTFLLILVSILNVVGIGAKMISKKPEFEPENKEIKK